MGEVGPIANDSLPTASHTGPASLHADLVATQRLNDLDQGIQEVSTVSAGLLPWSFLFTCAAYRHGPSIRAKAVWCCVAFPLPSVVCLEGYWLQPQ